MKKFLFRRSIFSLIPIIFGSVAWLTEEATSGHAMPVRVWDVDTVRRTAVYFFVQRNEPITGPRNKTTAFIPGQAIPENNSNDYLKEDSKEQPKPDNSDEQLKPLGEQLLDELRQSDEVQKNQKKGKPPFRNPGLLDLEPRSGIQHVPEMQLNLPIATGMPREHDKWDAGDGNVYELGGFVASGRHATVYRLKTFHGHMIKLYRQANGVSASAMVQKIIYGYNLLVRRGIPQLNIVRFQSHTAIPYVIQEEADEQMIVVDPQEAVWDDLSPDRKKAAMKLRQNLSEKGLIWNDAHIGNIFFAYDSEGGCIAGILDQEEIIPL